MPREVTLALSPLADRPGCKAPARRRRSAGSYADAGSAGRPFQICSPDCGRSDPLCCAQAALEDSLVAVSAILASRYVGGIRPEVERVERQLAGFSGTLDLWVQVRRYRKGWAPRVRAQGQPHPEGAGGLGGGVELRAPWLPR